MHRGSPNKHGTHKTVVEQGNGAAFGLCRFLHFAGTVEPPQNIRTFYLLVYASDQFKSVLMIIYNPIALHVGQFP